MTSKLGKLAVGSLTGTVGAGLASYILLRDGHENWPSVKAEKYFERLGQRPLPTRAEQIKSLQEDSFDVLIIGGGATGAGCALDASTRGLKTALIEADDFSSGSSSRSTKLIHGGVRYLQKALMGLDYEQYKMVKEALNERATVLEQAPHLAHLMPIILPVYKWWQVPYFWIGIKMYDLVAGSKVLKSSYYLSKNNALELFPMLKSNKLCGGIVYYDGQMDDARMNVAIVLTAARLGATVANHVTVTGFIKEEQRQRGKEVICGVCCRDETTGKTWTIPVRCVVNATGPFTDSIRKMDNPNVKTICSPSSGVHITLPGYYTPQQMGLLDPATSDGRVIFFLPWQNHTIAGTTDLPCDVTPNPGPSEAEISFILEEIKNYLNSDVNVRRSDVLSAWSGIRPLVSDPNKPDTQSLARNHVIHVSDSDLVTIAGGKWTTYRSMAEETIDTAINVCSLESKCKSLRSQTRGLLLEGAHKWTPTMYIRLVQDCGFECEVAEHLATSYGDRAFKVAEMAHCTGKRWPIIGSKIHPEFPYIEAEVRYACTEYAVTAIDMIARRLRLAFLNVQATQEALPQIVNIMAEELGWSEEEKCRQIQSASKFLQYEMGQNIRSSEKIPIDLSKEEVQLYVQRFHVIDRDGKGYVSFKDITRNLKQYGEEFLSPEEAHNVLGEMNINMNGKVALDDYIQIMGAIKSGHLTYSRVADMAEFEEQQRKKKEKLKKHISVERSGGGL